MPLPDTKIRSAKPKAKPYKLFDGGGLFLLVNPNGSKLWRQKYRYAGKERLHAIGAYPTIGAALARQERDTVKGLLAQGIDPTQHKRISKAHKEAASENTFEAMARRWLDIKKIKPRHRAKSLRRLELYIFPKLGFRPIADITTPELVACLETIERRGILETAHRVKQFVQQTFRYAVRCGLITHNPAGDLRDIIATPDKKHFACISPAELPELLRAIENYQGSILTISAIKLLALTAVRTGELIGAKWSEIDWSRQEWLVPAERMKMKKSHIVPLSRQALAVFKELQAVTGRHEYVFHSPANKSGHLSNGAVLGALRRMGYAKVMTGHGYRTLFSTILNEGRAYDREIIERQLSHGDPDEVRSAYNRADYLLERKKLMQDWANFLAAQLAADDTDRVVQASFRKHRK